MTAADMIAIEPGIVQTGEVTVIHDEPRFIVWHVDMLSKYAVVASVGSTNGKLFVSLGADDRTLDIDSSRGLTDITIAFPGAHEWIVMAECRRYTTRIVVYNPDLLREE